MIFSTKLHSSNQELKEILRDIVEILLSVPSTLQYRSDSWPSLCHSIIGWQRLKCVFVAAKRQAELTFFNISFAKCLGYRVILYIVIFQTQTHKASILFHTVWFWSLCHNQRLDIVQYARCIAINIYTIPIFIHNSSSRLLLQ